MEDLTGKQHVDRLPVLPVSGVGVEQQLRVPKTTPSSRWCQSFGRMEHYSSHKCSHLLTVVTFCGKEYLAAFSGVLHFWL